MYISVNGWVLEAGWGSGGLSSCQQEDMAGRLAWQLTDGQTARRNARDLLLLCYHNDLTR